MVKVKQQRSAWFKGLAAASTISEEGNQVSGYLAAFGNIDSDRDIIVKGAFSKSIQERGPDSNTHRKIAYLYAHDQKIPLGQFKKLEEQMFGLYYEAVFDKIPFVEQTIKPQMKSGTLNNHSIGYNYVYDKMEYDESQDAFICREINLFEGSVLTLGSNPNTPVVGFKSYLEQRDDFNSMAIDAERLLKSINHYGNEMELRNILQKYQSLLDHAAEEITAIKSKKSKATLSDYKYIIDNFKL
jgi:HK97 family phage prohead protease